MVIDPNKASQIGEGNNFKTDYGILFSLDRVEATEVFWPKLNAPYVFNGGVQIGSENGTSLTIEAGTTIKLSANVNIGYALTSKATVTSKGTASEPITWTSIESNPAPADWGNILIGEGSINTIFDYNILEYGGKSTSFSGNGLITLENGTAIINNSIFRNYGKLGLVLDELSYFKEFNNNTFESIDRDGILINAKWVHTIGTNNTFSNKRGVVVEAGRIDQGNVTWNKINLPYYIDGYIYIGSDAGSMLTIAPGNTIAFGKGERFWIGGSKAGGIIADGTEEVILFTSGWDPVGNDDWAPITIGSTALQGTIINNCILEYGGYEEFRGTIDIGYTDVPVITNNIIRNSASYGISVQNANPTISGNTFENLAKDDFYYYQ